MIPPPNRSADDVRRVIAACLARLQFCVIMRDSTRVQNQMYPRQRAVVLNPVHEVVVQLEGSALCDADRPAVLLGFLLCVLLQTRTHLQGMRNVAWNQTGWSISRKSVMMLTSAYHAVLNQVLPALSASRV